MKYDQLYTPSVQLPTEILVYNITNITFKRERTKEKKTSKNDTYL